MSVKKYVAGITASIAFFSSLLVYEGYQSKPYRDSTGKPTIGIGTTQYPNGSPVRMSDAPITQEKAIQLARTHVSKIEKDFRKSLVGARLSQIEYDLYLDFVYQFGIGNWQKSSMLRLLRQHQNKGACERLLRWRFAGGKDCAHRANGCYGVWLRQQDRHQKCLKENP